MPVPHPIVQAQKGHAEVGRPPRQAAHRVETGVENVAGSHEPTVPRRVTDSPRRWINELKNLIGQPTTLARDAK
jgi:hypothetical protein